METLTSTLESVVFVSFADKMKQVLFRVFLPSASFLSSLRTTSPVDCLALNTFTSLEQDVMANPPTQKKTIITFVLIKPRSSKTETRCSITTP